jgi:hypothetical protein
MKTLNTHPAVFFTAWRFCGTLNRGPINAGADEVAARVFAFFPFAHNNTHAGSLRMGGGGASSVSVAKKARGQN